MQHSSPHASGSLVTPPSAAVIASSSNGPPDLALADECAAELRQRHALDIRVAGLVRDRERGACVAFRLGEVVGPLGLLDRRPADVAPGAGEQSARPRDPARGLGVAAADPVLAREIGRELPDVVRVAAPLVGGVGLAAAVDRRVALAEPLQRVTEPVERLGVARVVAQRGGERLTRAGPVGFREALPAGRAVSIGP